MSSANEESDGGPLITVGGQRIDLAAGRKEPPQQGEPVAGVASAPISVETPASLPSQRLPRPPFGIRSRYQLLIAAAALVGAGLLLGLALDSLLRRRRG